MPYKWDSENLVFVHFFTENHVCIVNQTMPMNCKAIPCHKYIVQFFNVHSKPFVPYLCIICANGYLEKQYVI